MNQPIIIGISGGSGSGKTYFLKKLLQQFEKNAISLFSLDNYYLPIAQQKKDKNGIENFDRPESLDQPRMVHDLSRLKKGEDITIDEYNFNYRDQPKRKITIKATPIIIAEGIFVLHYKEMKNLLDLKIFIETPDYLMLKRRILRDAEERGYDIQDVLYRFEHHVMPAYRQFIYPSRHEADMIIPNHTHFENALEVVTMYISQILSQHFTLD
jgi:uridine kinase